MLKKAKSVAVWTALTLFALWLLSLHTQWKINRAIKKIEGRCYDVKDKIFVALVCRASRTAGLLFSLFEKASCPKSINVSVYEIQDGEDSLDAYRAKAKTSETGLSYEKQVHIMKRDIEDTGLYGALKELMTHGYKNEKFVCTISEGFVAEDLWDETLIKSLKPMTCLVMGSGYPYISGFEQDFPVFGYKDIAAPTPSRFWTMNGSFAPAQFWGTFLDPLLFAGNATEFLVSCHALERGWKFMHIPMTFDKALHFQWPLKPLNAKAFKAMYARLLTDMHVIPSLSKNALLGMVDERDETEIQVKYGSRSEYVYAVNKMLN